MARVSRGKRRLVGLLWFEGLEPRALLTAITPTPAEQLTIELLNRARANPTAEAARYGIDLNEGPPSMTLSSSPAQPLAFNPELTDAARLHSQFMLDNDQFAHNESVNGVQINTSRSRMQAAGYPIDPFNTVTGENIAYRGQTNTPPAQGVIVPLSHEDLFVDEGIDGRGHRINILYPSYREVGVGVVSGDFTSGGKTYKSVMTTQDFAGDPSRTFITGVAFTDDITADNFYTIGEGVGGVTITATPVGGGTPYSTTTWDAGGYSLMVPNGSYTLTASGGPLTQPFNSNVTVNGKNVKVDYDLNSLVPPPPPDLAVAFGTFGFPDIVIPGDSYKIPLTLTNLGDGVARGKVNVELFLSTDDTIDAGDLAVGAKNKLAVNLEKNAVKPLTLAIKVPGSASEGPLRLLARITCTLTLPDDNAFNNTADLGETRAANVEYRFGEVPGRAKPVKLTLLDDNGKAVNFALTGPGNGFVDRDDNGSFAVNLVTGGKTTFNLTTARGVVARLASLDISGEIRAVNAKTTDLVGDVNTPNPLGSLNLRDIVGERQINLSPPLHTFPKPATITFRNADDLTINSQQGLARVAASGAWNDGALTGTYLGVLAVKGAFGADVNLNGQGAPGGDITVTLLSATIGGPIDGSTWNIEGNAGLITTRGGVNDWKLNQQNGLGVLGLKLGDTVNSQILCTGAIGTLSAYRIAGGSINAAGMILFNVTGSKKLALRGDVSAAIQITDSTYDAASFKIAGVLHDTVVRFNTTVRKVTLGAIDNASLLNAVDSDLGERPTAEDFAGAGPEILSIAVGGVALDDTGVSFRHAYLAASIFGKVTLKLVDTTADGGVIANTLVRSYKRGTNPTLKNIDNSNAPKDLDTQGLFRLSIVA